MFSFTYEIIKNKFNKLNKNKICNEMALLKDNKDYKNININLLLGICNNNDDEDCNQINNLLYCYENNNKFIEEKDNYIIEHGQCKDYELILNNINKNISNILIKNNKKEIIKETSDEFKKLCLSHIS